MFIFMLVYLIMFAIAILILILTPIHIIKFLIEQMIFFNNAEFKDLSLKLLKEKFSISFNMILGNIDYVNEKFENYSKDSEKLDEKIKEIFKID